MLKNNIYNVIASAAYPIFIGLVVIIISSNGGGA
jgi:hypothetical protein